MTERDESRDVGVDWECSEGYPDEVLPWLSTTGGPVWTRYVPHSDLEAAERERDALRDKVRNLEAENEIARKVAESTTRDFEAMGKSLRAALRNINEALDKTVPF